MKYEIEDIAKQLFEIASEQRLRILFKLSDSKLSVTKLAKELDATTPEVFRNVQRLVKEGLIEKDTDGNYTNTLHGNTIIVQLPSIFFIKDNKKYFQNHNLGNLPIKFIQRIGALESAKHVKGFVKVIEKWKHIHENSEKYIFNILSEVPYSEDIIKVVALKAKEGVNIRSIFSQDTIIPDDRKKIFSKLKFQKFIDEKVLERKMQENIEIVVLVNEKEAGVLFSNNEGMIDMSEMLYSTQKEFQEWCLDYFNSCWENAEVFQERKLN